MDEFTLRYRPRTPIDIPIFLGRGARSMLPEKLRAIHCDSVHVIADSRAYQALAHLNPLAGVDHHLTLIVPGEDDKNMDSLNRLCETFFRQGGTRNSCVVAFGGGFVGNIAGLVAALAYRGVALIHVPTTLVSQLDSAVDVKQSVNLLIKNGVGVYYPPRCVIVDPDLLGTLGDRDIRSGLAEALKHGFAQDMSLVAAIDRVNTRDLAQLEEIIRRTIELKLEHYHGTPAKWQEPVPQKRLTHVGHSVGKVLEALHPRAFTHGEAISLGLVAECILSMHLGLLRPADVDLIVAILMRARLLPRLPPACTPDAVLDRLVREDVRPTFALLGGLGDNRVEAVVVDAPTALNALKEWLSRLSQREAAGAGLD